jgi:ABC-type lipoprotein export system ATPase subunit
MCDDVVYVFATATKPTVALQRVHLSVAAAETVAVTGPSGSGKSTLLGVLSGALTPSAGAVRVLGRDPRDRRKERLRSVGVVLQSPSRNLLPHVTALQNLLLVMRAAGRDVVDPRRAASLLSRLALDHVGDTLANRLSGGEQQRLAVAVALASRPRVLLADEPTSQQDAHSAGLVASVLRDAADDGAAVVAVTHDDVLAASLDRAVVIRDGILGAESRAGREVVLVRADGTVQLPEELVADGLPPGTALEVEATPDGAVLRRVDP